MASYSNLLRRVTTAEINRIQREGNYSRWAYFIDETTAKVGVVFASDTTFAAFTVPDEPDPKLQHYGIETISKLTMTPDEQLLVLATDDNLFQAVVFTDLTTVLEDDLLPSFKYDTSTEWQQFMRDHDVQIDNSAAMAKIRLVLYIIIAAAIVVAIFAVVINNLSPGHITNQQNQ